VCTRVGSSTPTYLTALRNWMDFESIFDKDKELNMYFLSTCCTASVIFGDINLDGPTKPQFNVLDVDKT
jgi:hypothetical protein